MAFQLKSNKKESENKTIRFPLPLVEQIDKAIENQDVTFSNFVIQACEYALENMEISEDYMAKHKMSPLAFAPETFCTYHLCFIQF